MWVRAALFVLLILVFNDSYGQSAPASGKTKVLTLGSFHFNFPNLDVRKVEASSQIDVLEPQYQKEIEDIVRRLDRFKPSFRV